MTLVFSFQNICLCHRNFQNIFKDHPIPGNLNFLNFEFLGSFGVGMILPTHMLEEDVAPVRCSLRYDVIYFSFQPNLSVLVGTGGPTP